MRKITFLFTCFLFLQPVQSQTIISRDPEISKMVEEISREKIEQHVRKLVSFHTRHNMSLQNDPSKGIGAAWNWIKVGNGKKHSCFRWPARS